MNGTGYEATSTRAFAITVIEARAHTSGGLKFQGLFIIQCSYIQGSVITLTPTLSLRERELLTDLFPENEKTLLKFCVR